MQKMRMVPLMKLLVVAWEDILKMTSDESFNPAVAVDKRLASFRTVGWLYQESDNTIMLVQEFDDKGMPHDWIVIPKSLITSIEIVRK